VVCSNQCAEIASCNIPIVNCAARCAATPLFHTCLAKAHPNCAEVAFCSLAGLCQPSGTRSCQSTMNCYDTCGGNTDCICACTRGASPSVGQLVLSRDACILVCGNNQQCIAQQCGQYTMQCQRQ
jgi:hypothetical protein